MAIVTLRTFRYIILFVTTVFYLLRKCHVTGIECGTVYLNQPLIRGGNAVQRNEWPFIVAVYEVEPRRFFCGGTLISNRHVLTGDRIKFQS